MLSMNLPIALVTAFMGVLLYLTQSDIAHHATREARKVEDERRADRAILRKFVT
jgi:hypothetical protein